MNEECIHGFERGFCAACYPPEPADVAEPAKKPRVVRSKPMSLREPAQSTQGSRSAGGSNMVGARPVDLDTRRIYRAVHIDEFSAIVTEGRIGDAHDDGAAAPIAFVLVPEASIGADVFAGERSATEFVVLVSTLRAALATAEEAHGPIELVEASPSQAIAAEATTGADLVRMLRPLDHEDAAERLAAAALTIPGPFPFERVALIGVPNDKVRLRVRELLSGRPGAPRVAVYPPWFQPTGELSTIG
ncbi:MAG: hypothetical protein ABWZ53_09610 [Actinomycetota bacterium]